jgi:short-subunit dehydrogenase
MPRDLRGKAIVITGASSGIGAATAIACAAAGMNVVLGARRKHKLDSIVSHIHQQNGHAIAQECDVTRDSDIQALIDRAEQHFNRLDVVFANAGYGLIAPLMHTTDPMMRAIFETNFYGTLRCIHAAVPAIRGTLRRHPADHGHILICSSAVSEIAIPRYSAYCATKAAQDSLAGALRAELEHENIDVTSVHPVGTSTEFFDQAARLSNLPSASSGNTHPAFRQSPQTVANAILRCLRRPKPEVWPQPFTRYGLAICTAFPRLAASVGRWKIKRD